MNTEMVIIIISTIPIKTNNIKYSLFKRRVITITIITKRPNIQTNPIITITQRKPTTMKNNWNQITTETTHIITITTIIPTITITTAQISPKDTIRTMLIHTPLKH